MKTVGLALAAFALLTFSARAEDKASKLIGKWEMTKGMAVGSTAEFTKDGKVKVIVKAEGKTETHEGTYKLDGDTLKLTPASRDMGGRKASWKIKKVTDRELVVLEDTGKEFTFKKVK